MPVFEYKAITKKSGKKTKGVLDAESPALARQKLRDMELYPTEIWQSKAAGKAGAKDGSGAGKAARGRISTRDIALTTRQLAVLLRAGMPLVGALGVMLDQTSRPRLRATLYDVRDRVNRGSSLGDALAAHPRVFTPLYVNMVRAGEASGTLKDVLPRLADTLEDHAKLKSQVLSSLAYPMFMGLFAVATVIFLMTVIVPKMRQIFDKQGAELPRLTVNVIAISDFVGDYWWLILGVFFLLLSLWRAWSSTEKGRLRWDRFKLRVPLYGALHAKMISVRFARTMGTMLQSGLTMLPALEVVGGVLENAHYASHMDDVKAGVRRGRDLAVPLRETGLFPPMLIQMIELGQRSGEIEEMLIRVAETYEEDVRLTVQALVGLVEPMIIIFMGLFVGTLVLAFLLPILTMSTNM